MEQNPSTSSGFPEKHPRCEGVQARRNFRSTAQNVTPPPDTLIANNVRRMEKTCFSGRQGELIRVIELPDEAAEAKWVAGTCRTYASYEGVHLKRTLSLPHQVLPSASFERALRFEGIPYTMA